MSAFLSHLKHKLSGSSQQGAVELPKVLLALALAPEDEHSQESELKKPSPLTELGRVISK